MSLGYAAVMFGSQGSTEPSQRGGSAAYGVCARVSGDGRRSGDALRRAGAAALQVRDRVHALVVVTNAIGNAEDALVMSEQLRHETLV